MQVTPHEVYLVVNAGCRDKDLEHIGKHLAAAKVGKQASAAAAAQRQRQNKLKERQKQWRQQQQQQQQQMWQYLR